MKAIRIVNALPSFYEICSYFSRTQNTRYVFVDTFYFRDEQLPSDKEWEIIDNNQIKINQQVVVTPTLIEQFGSRFLVTANCIHVYDSLSDNIRSESILFKKLNWDWAYHCYDGTLVEIFIQNNHEDAYKAIKEGFMCEGIEFPGLIPNGLNILD